MPRAALTPLGFDPDLISVETLDEEIVALTGRMTAQEYELLTLIRSFDERGGWLKWGSASCAEWLHWRCDLSLSAAREKVRVAHALKVLPRISAAFAEGRLSYSKVRALTRVASSANENELLDFALQVSASLVEQRCQQLRNARPAATGVAQRSYERRSLSAHRDQQKNTMTLTAELPLEDGELILTALDQVLARVSDAADASSSYRVRQADALVQLCRERLSEPPRAGGESESADSSDVQSLRGGIEVDDVAQASAAKSRSADGDPERQRLAAHNDGPLGSGSRSTGDAYQVVIHTDATAVSGEADSESSTSRSDLPSETIRRLCCDGNVVPISNGADGNPLHVGRRRRTVSTALKRALLARDRHCRYPGCTHTRFVDAHHVQHWAQGGETCLENLMLLCGHHHRLVHEGGFQIVVDKDGRHAFRRPDGRCVPASGYRLEDQRDEMNTG